LVFSRLESPLIALQVGEVEPRQFFQVVELEIVVIFLQDCELFLSNFLGLILVKLIMAVLHRLQLHEQGLLKVALAVLEDFLVGLQELEAHSV